MSKGIVDHTVKNKAAGEAILFLLLDVVKPGSFIRVSSKTIRVDKSACSEYPTVKSAQEEVSALPG